ncbi:DUF2637 domain-containing protein [Streptomyces sp. AM8-1-1]|uniref:DUF2637 domain-containing protein n=1 Tax=Streptomyces sp. AM8-1-1 TaxID=3075825 RepID=UPI0028C474F4|nr:DUF2637 domain-containing protein [Streptomyces sp. AM8-1-1]WNO73078.1 DUF2637 domain-containing protein [Streptomyces sp. AM8-1-1]
MSEDRITQRTVTVVMVVIAALAFVFSFGNVWSLALRLGVPAPIAPLIAPMVDLSVVGLLVALRYLSLRGVPAEQMCSPTRLMHISGLLTLSLNIAEPIAAGHYGRAAVDAVAPLLLLGWGTVGPQLLRHFHTVTQNAEPTVAKAATPSPESTPSEASSSTENSTPTPVPFPPAPVAVPVTKVPQPLLSEARAIAASHRTEHGAPITPAQLKMRLGIGLPMATALHAAL